MTRKRSLFRSKKKMPFILKVTRLLYPFVEKKFPKLAHKWALKKFSTPFRFPFKPQEQKLKNKAWLSTFQYKDKKIQLYEWNVQAEDKTVLLVHGWAGRGTQFWGLTYGLINLGYHVITFDALAHGESQGKQTHLFDFRNIILKIAEEKGDFQAIVGHSLGGVAVGVALKEKLVAKKAFIYNSPTVSREIIDAFVYTIKGSPALSEYFAQYMEDNFNVTLEDYQLMTVVGELLKKGVEIHALADADDMDVPVDNSRRLKSKYPEIGYYETKELGHNKILGDEGAIKYLIEALEEKEVDDATIQGRGYPI